MQTLVFTPQAVRDIESIWDYTADRWGVDQAGRYTATIRETCEALARGDLAGRDASDIRAGYRKAQSGRHVIFVRTRPDKALEVVRILHERMDMSAKFTGEGAP